MILSTTPTIEGHPIREYKAVDFSALCRVKTQPMGLAFTTKPVVI